MENKDKKWLSASGIETLEVCSFKYYQQNVIRVPQKPNLGSTRGSEIHVLFEILLNKRHKKHVDAILAKESVEGSPAVNRLMIKMMKADGIFDTLNYDIMNQMLLVGLKRDFYGEFLAGQVSKPEYKFELENEEPKYRIRGILDKYIKYPNDLVIIRDFKSSKSKFSKEDLTTNNQAMVYSLVGYKQLGAKDVKTEFLFLRFPKQPIQEVHLTKEQLSGYEHYLAYLYGIIENFDENAAKSNFAGASRENSWLCQKGGWQCPFLKSFIYYAVVDEKGSTIRTSLNKASLKVKEGQKIVDMQYGGCFFWNEKNKPTPDDEM
jgi:hypothetical protein